MTICRNHLPTDPFARIDKYLINDSSISWKAKGILTYAFSKPDGWKFYQTEIMNNSSDGKDALKSGLEELEKAGYLHRQKINDPETGRFKFIWHWYSRPITEEEFKNNLPNTENPHTVNPDLAEPATTKNDIGNKKDTKESVAGKPASKISFIGKDGKEETLDENQLYQKIVSSKVDWTGEEIAYACEALDKTTCIVYDWFRFLEGTIDNFRKKQKSKRASGEQRTRSSSHKSQKRRKGQCETNVNQKQKNINKCSSEKDSLEQLWQEFVCPMDLLRRSQNGSNHQKTS